MNTNFPQIAPMALRHHIKVDPGVALLDVRSPAEYRAGHIPSARLVPLDSLKASAVSGLLDDAGYDADHPIYVTCHAGDRAERAAQLLQENGVRHLVLVEGGTQAWQNAGLPVNSCGNTLSLERQVQIAIGSLLILKVVFGFTVHELFFVAGAVIGAGLITAGITRWCGMASLIARLPWNRGGDCGQKASALALDNPSQPRGSTT